MGRWLWMRVSELIQIEYHLSDTVHALYSRQVKSWKELLGVLVAKTGKQDLKLLPTAVEPAILNCTCENEAVCIWEGDILEYITNI